VPLLPLPVHVHLVLLDRLVPMVLLIALPMLYVVLKLLVLLVFKLRQHVLFRELVVNVLLVLGPPLTKTTALPTPSVVLLSVRPVRFVLLPMLLVPLLELALIVLLIHMMLLRLPMDHVLLKPL
tara:strand:- start:51 stop:422 length:372 start_codon:yes stop_codon:yes gene_type:complete